MGDPQYDETLFADLEPVVLEAIRGGCSFGALVEDDAGYNACWRLAAKHGIPYDWFPAAVPWTPGAGRFRFRPPAT